MKEILKTILIKIHIYSLVKNAFAFSKKIKQRFKYIQTKEYRDFNKRRHFYSKFIKSGNLVFDIGANIGNRSEVFLALGAKVIAVEPQSNCINILKDKFKSNKDFHLIEKGMDSKKGKTTIQIANADTISSMSDVWINKVKEGVFKNYTWDRTEFVEVDTLDSLIKEFGTPDFIKIDVEGFELNVLKGLTKQVNIISYEFMTPEFYKNALDCLEYLETLGKIKCNFSWGESMQLTSKEWVNSEQFKNILKDISNVKDFGDIYVRFVED